MHEVRCDSCVDARVTHRAENHASSHELAIHYFSHIYFDHFSTDLLYGLHTFWTLICIYQQLKGADGPIALAA